jgi:hypothetical protein
MANCFKPKEIANLKVSPFWSHAEQGKAPPNQPLVAPKHFYLPLSGLLILWDIVHLPNNLLTGNKIYLVESLCRVAFTPERMPTPIRMIAPTPIH